MITEVDDSFFKDIASQGHLSHSAQKELARKYQEDGDPIAKEKLITSNMRLVIKLAKQIAPKNTYYWDMIQAGLLGLTKAVERFDPDNGAKFTSYAALWVRANMYKQLTYEQGPVNPAKGRGGRKIVNNLRKMRSKHGDNPKKIAEELGVSKKQVRQISTIIDRSMAPVFEDTVVQEWDNRVEKAQEDHMIKTLMEEFGKSLEGDDAFSCREVDIWISRTYTDGKGETLQSVADRWGVSKERIRQIEVEVKEKFKDYYLESDFRYKDIGCTK